MSKTPQEKLQQFSQDLIDIGRYSEKDLLAFKAELMNLFNEPALNEILFKFYSSINLTTEEREEINEIWLELINAGDVPGAQCALSLGADALYKYENPLRPFPLHNAAIAGNIDMIRLLCKAGFNPNRVGAWADLPIYLAARVGNAEVVKVLVEEFNASMDYTPYDLHPSPLTIAARNAMHGNTEEQRCGCREVVRYLLSKGISDFKVNPRIDIGWRSDFDLVIAEERVKLDAILAEEAQAQGAAGFNLDDILISEARLLLGPEGKEIHDEMVRNYLGNINGTIDDAIRMIQNYGGSIVLAVRGGNLSCIKELIDKGVDPLLNIEDKDIAAKIKKYIASEVTAGASSSSVPTVNESNPEEGYEASEAAAGRPYEVSMAGSLAPESHADSDLE